MKRKYGLLKLLALPCIFVVCVLVTVSCFLHKPNPTDLGQNSAPAIVSVGGRYENHNINDFKQGIVSIDHPVDYPDFKRDNYSITLYKDVNPTAWAFQSLQSLVERYGVIQVYSDKTFRGDRAATRYELAHMLNTALDMMDRTYVGKLKRTFISKRDLVNLTESANEESAKVATLRGLVDSLETRLNVLEKMKMN